MSSIQSDSETKIQDQTRQVQGPLDHLRLNSDSPTQKARLDKASAIDRVSSYLRPQILSPLSATTFYRDESHISDITRQTFDNTIPDRLKSPRFVKDLQGDILHQQNTKCQKIPRSASHTVERVSVGARGVANGHNNPLNSSDKAHVDVSENVGLPFHSAKAAGPKQVRVRSDCARPQRTQAQINVPENFYTAPLRLSTAYAAATRNAFLKRKRPTHPSTPPPPSYIHQHSGNPTFNVFSNGILLYPELCLLLAAQLPVQTLINLYSISKDFHVIVNQRFITVILNQATLKAPNAIRCYPWRCFKSLSQPDPSLRAGTLSLADHLDTACTGSGDTSINVKTSPTPPTHRILDPHLNQTSAFNRSHLRPQLPCARRVPTFGWLHLAIHREEVIHALYQVFAARGVPLPGAPHHAHLGSFCQTLHKMWFLFDLPDNPRRIHYAHDRKLMTDADLANILVFVTKLDMVCNSPLAAEKRDAMRKLLLSSVDGFDTILKVVKQDSWEDELQLLRAWTRYGLRLDHESAQGATQEGGFMPFRLTAEQLAQSKTVFGIPRDEAGMLKREFWGKIGFDPVASQRRFPPNGVDAVHGLGRPPAYLIRPDQLALREMIRRGMVFSRQYLRGLLHGYVAEETLKAVPPRELNGGRSVVLEKEGEYCLDDAVAGVRALSLEEGGDELLDLGDTSQGSKWTVRHQLPSIVEVQRRKHENELLNEYMMQWREDVEVERRRKEYTGFHVVG